MRLVKATLKEVYAVHKTYSEFLSDNGCHEADPELYRVWPVRLTNPLFRYVLLLHSRKVIGMLWGKELIGETRKTFLIEGRFLRRAFRGKLKFSRELISAQKEITKDFESVLVLLPHRGTKINKKNKVLGTLVKKF